MTTNNYGDSFVIVIVFKTILRQKKVAEKKKKKAFSIVWDSKFGANQQQRQMRSCFPEYESMEEKEFLATKKKKQS